MTVAPVLLAVDVAASLTQAGLVATTRLTEDGTVELLVMVKPGSRTMGILDVCDLSAVLIDDGVATLTVPGPVEPGADTCDDPACLSAAVWAWVLRWRGVHI